MNKMANRTKFYHQKFEAYINLDGDIVYMANQNNKYEIITIHHSGIKEIKYKGNSEKVANNWLNKIIGGKDG